MDRWKKEKRSGAIRLPGLITPSSLVVVNINQLFSKTPVNATKSQTPPLAQTVQRYLTILLMLKYE